jgi:hypothetical protein
VGFAILFRLVVGVDSDIPVSAAPDTVFGSTRSWHFVQPVKKGRRDFAGQRGRERH